MSILRVVWGWGDEKEWMGWNWIGWRKWRRQDDYRELKSVELDQQFVSCRFSTFFLLFLSRAVDYFIFLIPPENCIGKNFGSFFRFSSRRLGTFVAVGRGRNEEKSEDYACKMKWKLCTRSFSNIFCAASNCCCLKFFHVVVVAVAMTSLYNCLQFEI